MKYLYWRGLSLWCRYPLSSYPACYPLGIKTTGSRTDKKRCEVLGETTLSALRTKAKEGTLFEKPEEEKPEEEPEYNPRFWRILGRYWYNHLRFKKTAKSEKFHLIHSLRKFGKMYAKDIEAGDINKWIERMKVDSQINPINNRLSNLKAVFNYANSEEKEKYNLNYNPTKKIKKLKGGNVRRFLLTPEIFERNYQYLKTKSPEFSLFYLALWETGRRPLEAGLYSWDMYSFDEQGVYIPKVITKTDEDDFLPFSDRLASELMKIPTFLRTGYMFKNTIGTPLICMIDGKLRNNCYYHMKKLRNKFGNDVGWARDTRRGFVTRKAEDEGFNFNEIMLVTGHKTFSTVKRYSIGKKTTKRRVVSGKLIHTNFIQLPKTG